MTPFLPHNPDSRSKSIVTTSYTRSMMPTLGQVVCVTISVP